MKILNVPMDKITTIRPVLRGTEQAVFKHHAMTAFDEIQYEKHSSTGQDEDDE